MKFKPVDTRQIEKAISKMRIYLGSGHEEISVYFLQASYPVKRSSSLRNIFFFGIISGSFPDCQKTARVFPILKEGVELRPNWASMLPDNVACNLLHFHVVETSLPN